MMAMEARVSRLEGAYEQVDRRLGDLTAVVEGVRVEMSARFETIEALLNALIAVIGAVGIAVAGGIVFLALRIP